MKSGSEHSTEPGRTLAAVVYLLYIGSAMAVVTAPLGALLAWFGMRRADAVARSHLLFQLRTFWLGALAAVGALLGWQLLGLVGAPAWMSWSLGYGFFLLALVWMLGRCGVGVRRLMSGCALEAPRSLLFGSGRI